MDKNKNSIIYYFCLILSNVLTKVTKHLCLLNLNMFFFGNKTVSQNWPYSLLGNFADVIYRNQQSVCIEREIFALCNLHGNIITAVLINYLSVI